MRRPIFIFRLILNIISGFYHDFHFFLNNIKLYILSSSILLLILILSISVSASVSATTVLVLCVNLIDTSLRKMRMKISVNFSINLLEDAFT